MIATGLKLSELTEKQRDWYAHAICTIVVSDGHVAPEEVQLLETSLSFLSSPSQINNLIELVRENRVPPLEPLADTEPEITTRMLLELTQACTSDLILTSREMECLFHTGALMGFPTEFVQLVIRWANEGILWKNKMNPLIDSGINLINRLEKARASNYAELQAEADAQNENKEEE